MNVNLFICWFEGFVYLLVSFLPVIGVGESGYSIFFFFQAEDGIRDYKVTGVQTCALPISPLPQNAALIFARKTAQGTTNIFRENADGTGLTNLTNDNSNDSAPALSADGKQIGRASCRERV